MKTIPDIKLNKTQLSILATSEDNKFGKGWVGLPNLRKTSRMAMKSLREAGLVEYVIADGYAGNQITPLGNSVFRAY